MEDASVAIENMFRVPATLVVPNATALAPDAETTEHLSHAVNVLAVFPEGRAAVDPVYVRYAPPDKLVAAAAVPHMFVTNDTPPGFVTVYPVVEPPVYCNTGVGIV